MMEKNNPLTRYNHEQRKVILDFFQKLSATTNKTGKMLESKQIKILQSWEEYPAEIVIDALDVYIKMEIAKSQRGRGKNERYVLGIMRNKAGEANAGGMVQGYGKQTGEDEGARIGALMGEHRPTDEELECEY